MKSNTMTCTGTSTGRESHRTEHKFQSEVWYVDCYTTVLVTYKIKHGIVHLVSVERTPGNDIFNLLFVEEQSDMRRECEDNAFSRGLV